MLQKIRQYINRAILKEPNFGPIKLVVIQPTTFCNLDCDYCYLPDRQLKYKISLDLLEPILKNIFASQLINQGFTLVWHAGEPLTVPISFYESAVQIIERWNLEINPKPYEITHSVQTNGTLITQDWCDFIKKYNFKIGVSVDGPDFIHDSHRKTRTGLGTHTSTMRGVDLLQKNDISFSVIAVITEKSLDYPDEIFDFFLENKMKYIGFNAEEIEGFNQFSSLNKNGVEERYRYFMQRFYARVKESDNVMRVREFDDIANFISNTESVIKGQFTPFNILNIAYNGDFSTFSPELLSMKSEIYGDFILGNILEHSITSIHQTDKFKKINRDIQAGVKLCQQSCQYFSVCGGGAPSNKYYENGSFSTTETLYCKYSKKIITDIVLEDIESSLEIN